MAPGETLLDVDIWQRSRIPVCARVRVAAGSNLSTAIRRFPGGCGPAASNRRHMITRSCIKLVRGGRSATLLGIIDSSSGIAARAFASVQFAIAQESVSSIWPPTNFLTDFAEGSYATVMGSTWDGYNNFPTTTVSGSYLGTYVRNRSAPPTSSAGTSPPPPPTSPGAATSPKSRHGPAGPTSRP